MRLTAPARRRRMSLTPMIDVVFLLLVFFMLAARFGAEGAIGLDLGGDSQTYAGPPRLVDVYPHEVRLNGLPIAADALPSALSALSESPSDVIVLRSRDGADVQRLVDFLDRLKEAGFVSLVLVE